MWLYASNCMYEDSTCDNPSIFTMWAYLMSYRSRFLRKEEEEETLGVDLRIKKAVAEFLFFSCQVKGSRGIGYVRLDRYWYLWKNMVQIHWKNDKAWRLQYTYTS